MYFTSKYIHRWLMLKSLIYLLVNCWKNLKIPKGESEPVNGRTDNTITNWKRTKGQTTIHKATQWKLKIEWHEPHSETVSSSCSISGTHRVTLVTIPIISHEWGRHIKVFATSGTYPWSFVTQIFHNGQPSHGGNRKTFEVMTST